MFLELIATFAIGFAVAGVILLVNRLSGSRLPGWFLPVGAGIGMLCFIIFNEYTWFQRTSAALPTGIEVAYTVEEKAAYRPWTYLWPYVDRFIAVDGISLKRNEKFPDQRIVDLLIYGRWAPVNRVRAVFDCTAGRRADLTEGVEFAEDGSLKNAYWHKTGLKDPVTQAACKVG